MSDEAVVGIDLGTSNTVVAVVQGNKATVIPDSDGNRIHPSVVSFHPNGSVLVGRDAKRRRIIDPANTIYSAKRLIGRSFRSDSVGAMIERCPYKVIEGDNQQSIIIARGNEYTVEEISAFVLRHVKALAETHIKMPIRQAVITVPANFNDGQREATRTAGRVAGLNVLRILNEPTAAALAYGYGRGLTNRIVIYDFGGGTFDITALQLNDRVFEVLSTAGDTFLGGDDIDERIVDHMVDLFLRQHRVDLRYNTNAMARLRSVGEQIKCQLSSRPKAVVQVQEIAYGGGGQPLDLNFTLTVEALNAMSNDLVQRSFLICDEAMGLAGLTATQIDDIVMVGGSTRMPLVRQAVQGYFGIDPRTDINPDEVVAIGAAIQAAALSRSGVTSETTAPAIPGAPGGAPAAGADGVDSVLLDVTPRALGLAVVGGYAETVIPRNSQIPVEQTRRFSTSQDNQSMVRLQVCQGESRLFEENEALGELLLEDIRQAPRGQVEIDVTFEIDTNGILQVSAVDIQTGRIQKARVQLLGTVDEAKVTNMQARQDQMPTAVHAPD
jgi:molecular chaperone DnaK